jgi:antitoxin MazE
MEVKVRRWGNSLGLRIPKPIAREVGIEEGSEVDLSVKDGDLVVRPLRRGKHSLKDLIRRITEENRHEVEDFGPPAGKEVW